MPTTQWQNHNSGKRKTFTGIILAVCLLVPAAASAAYGYAEERIYRNLSSRIVPDGALTPELERDLKAMSAYYSLYPEVVALIGSLEGYRWHIHYSPNNFSTRIDGTRLQVRGVTLHFDSRAAAQYKFHKACHSKRAHCIAAPADLFLHELLHVHAAVKNPADFIAEGGLNHTLYPYQHEQAILQLEAQLYQAMSARDQKPRPLRTEHRGKFVRVACTTCLQ